MRLDDSELLLLKRAVEERCTALAGEASRKVRSTLGLNIRDLNRTRLGNYTALWTKLNRECLKRYENGGPTILAGFDYGEKNGQSRGGRDAAAKRRR